MKLRSVQVLRAVAACAVVAFHAYGYVDLNLTSRARIGAAGVDLFFVISGFIMATISAGKTPIQFLGDRVWRIYPLWFIAMVPWLFAFHQSPQSLAASFTLWPVYGSAYYFPALKLGWTLSFEMLFYLAMALALATRPAVPLLMFAACLLLGFATGSALFDFTGSPMIIEFLMGVAIAKLPKVERLGVGALIAGLACFLIAPLSVYSQEAAIVPELAIGRVLAWGVPAALIFYAGVSMERRFAGRAFDFPVLLGNASYSIYLFHLLVIRVVPFHWVLDVVAAVSGGVMAYLTIERPIMRWRHQLTMITMPSPPRPPIPCTDPVSAPPPPPPPQP